MFTHCSITRHRAFDIVRYRLSHRYRNNNTYRRNANRLVDMYIFNRFIDWLLLLITYEP